MSARERVKSLARIIPEWAWNSSKRRPIASYNPTREPAERKKEFVPVYSVFDYNSEIYEEKKFTNKIACYPYLESGRMTWINVDGLHKEDVEALCDNYKIHHLLVEDILSLGQRAKMDEVGNMIFCLLPMLYYNEETGEIETEQVSIVLGYNFVISFQEDPERDVFNTLRDKIRNGNAQIRSRPADYMCYSLIDAIVDSYFGVIEKINERIENLEDSLLLQKERAALAKISILRREVMMMRRAIGPVRELVQGFLRSDSPLLEDRHEKYYKDVLDHITLAIEYTDNHRDMMMNLQDLSMSQINTRMNEVMKVFTLLATLMAPATVIGGIFGMNFDVIPLAHHQDGFYVTVALMLIIPLVMFMYFKKKGWY